MTNSVDFNWFDSKALTYNPYNAYLLALVSELTYRQEQDKTNEQWRETVKHKGQEWGFAPEHIYCFDYKGSQAILLADSEKIIVGFRGSEERSDWLHNLNRIKQNFPYENDSFQIHSGFLSYFNLIWLPYPDPKGRKDAQGMKAIIQEEIKEQKKALWFTGHSLGAAAAMVAATTCLAQNPPIEVQGLYTFGQPRIGDKEFVDWFNERLKSRTFRFVNNNDAVTRVPTWAPNFFFHHAGQIKYLTEDGQIVDYEKLNWWQRLQQTFGGIAEDILDSGLDSVKDHNMTESYIPPLRKALLKQTGQKPKAGLTP